MRKKFKSFTNMRFTLLFIISVFPFVFSLGQEIDLETYLPKNYSKKGDIDYTIHLQKGINENKIIKMPDFPVSINSKGLKIPSNRKIIFQENSRLILIPSNTRSYDILGLNMVENIEIINPRIIGERKENFGKNKRTGEWGMGISIRSSKNIKILGGVLENFWGDGIYLGKNNEYKEITNSNILIEGTHIKKARRNGISVTTANNLIIKDVRIEKVSGKSPQAALDIEPNGRADVIKKISIINLETINSGTGILISLRKLIDRKPQEVSVNIENHTDRNSVQAFRFAGFNNAYELNGLKRLTGTILVNNSLWVNNKGTFTYEKGLGLMPTIIFKGITYKKLNETFDLKPERFYYITKREPNIRFE
ncbi:hypothetical protein HMPREF2660_03035 [Weeksella sp. HMSC059D05]|nr:right-handed parallel beta-helix repeat-containing protein [Weeksella virosa]MDK7674211.1 right-handed parallel beta-helix repeat-containing protein [Weeksella virosa]OFM82644.1 hypothetical protein HMPREF2660_03035 [Weeksella sp. HMSC059D05]SUP53963.1 Uncharacterised protein [Weeksella virosa]